MSAALLPVWALLLGTLALLALAVVRATRRTPNAPAPRSIIALVAVGCVTTSVCAALILAIIPTVVGAERTRASAEVAAASGEADPSPNTPARARLFLRHVRTDTRSQRVGYSPTADLLLPALYRLLEGERAWDLFTVESVDETVTVRALETPEPTSTRLRFHSTPRAPSKAELYRFARSCREPSTAIAMAGSVVTAVVCRGRNPRSLLTFEEAGGSLLLTPTVWRRSRLEPHHIEIEAKQLIQIGATTAAVPGVTLWEVPAPRHRSELFSAPSSLLGDCGAFAKSVFGSAEPERVLSGQSGAACAIPFSPPFALEVRRLVPDVAGVSARVSWMLCLLLLPFLGWACFLLLAKRPRAFNRELGALTRFGIITAALIGLFSFRLLWAHRIDMLRDWTVVGDRTVGNLVSIAAVFVGLAIYAGLATSKNRHRWLWTVGWCAGAAGLALGFAPAELTGSLGNLVGQLGLAIAVGSISVWKPIAKASYTRGPSTIALTIGLVSLATSVVWPRSVALKLLLACSAIVVCYRVMRMALASGSPRTRNAIALDFVSVLIMIGGIARLDTGLTVVFVIPAFFVAIALAGHDALFGPQALAEVKSYRLRGLPLVRAQGGVIAGLAVCVLGWALWGLVSGPNPSLATSLTGGAPHLLLIVSALFAAPALIAHRRADRRTAIAFASAAAVVTVAWLLRDTVAEWVLSSSAPAAQRYAVIADPGYALLADPSAFLSGITGWAETIFADSADVMGGVGYFGAQLIDPGVLLSVENDYLPILILRELGVVGVAMTALTSMTFVLAAWLAGREHTPLAGVQGRSRLALVIVISLAMIYQPLAALGTLPLTGVSWLGFGVDSPSDLWMALGILFYLSALDIGQDASEEGATETSNSGRFERTVRLSRRFVRQERWVVAAAGLAVVCGTMLVARAAVFAGSRPEPVGEDGAASAPFASLETALDYARGLNCEVGDDGTMVVSGTPTDRGTRRFHKKLLAAATSTTLAPSAAGTQRRIGLVTIAAHTPSDEEDAEPLCAIKLNRRALLALRVRSNRPFEQKRIRLTSKPMGIAARDHGELVSGNVVIRLRATSAEIKAPTAPGLYAGKAIELGAGITLKTTDGGAVSVVRDAHDARENNDVNEWLFVADRQRAKVGVRPAHEQRSWLPVPDDGEPLALDRDALIVVGELGGRTRNVWLYRSATLQTADRTSDQRAPALAGSLLADDAQTIAGTRRRLYIYGNELPELGWVNPFRRRGSVGLDGWVSTAISEWNPTQATKPASCGTLRPAAVGPGDVCTWNEADNLVDCQVSIQPELSIRMRHLTEMIAASPEEFAPELGADKIRRPLRASFVVLRGDTGEIAAQGSFVPGRASPAYAPTTRALETHLIRLREDRDPLTGARLPQHERGEASAEKVEHNRPIAIGSVFKPMLARAFEQTAPTLARRLILVGTANPAGSCRGGRAHAIFGHCPATDSLWNRAQPMDITSFLGQSSNWTMAALAMVGTALPDGRVGLGDTSVDFDELVNRNVGEHATDAALWTEFGGETVISANRRMDPKALRATPMWQRFEAIVGRQLCTDGNKAGCQRRAVRRDLCAARALPLDKPSSDLRQVVSLGPSTFDFYPVLKNRDRDVKRIPTREYLQFLRGSGVHSLGTLAQVTDAFNRVVYESDRDPLADGPYQLAASWFPAPVAGEIPESVCRDRRGGPPTNRGICSVIYGGTANRALRGVAANPNVSLYGAKTGTIDSLGDIAGRAERCQRYRDAHTLTDRRRVEESQPYWLECDKNAKTNDSLLVLSLAVHVGGKRVPLTIGLSFVRSGSGFAAYVARHYVDLLVSYFGIPVESTGAFPGSQIQ